MRPQLFLGDGAGKLIDVSDRAGPPVADPRLGRGLAVGDVDNDGRIDLLMLVENCSRCPASTIRRRLPVTSSRWASREPPPIAMPWSARWP